MSSTQSLVSMFDEYCRGVNFLLQNDCTAEFLLFVKNQEQVMQKWRESVKECKRLKSELDNGNLKISELEKKLNRARVLLDSEKKNTLRAECERDELREQVAQIDDILSSVRRAGDKLANETKEKLDKFLSATHSKLGKNGDYVGYKLDTIDEINSTDKKKAKEMYSSSSTTQSSSSWSIRSGSLLSDVSYSRSEDNIDLNASFSGRGAFKKPRRSISPQQDDIIFKKRRSSGSQARIKKIQKSTSEHVIATTTVTVPKTGPVLACSKIETIPDGNQLYLKPSAPPKTPSDTDSVTSEIVKPYPIIPSTTFHPSSKLFTRSHCFRNKTLLKPSEECGVCQKKITFGNKFFCCPDCRVLAHPECKDKVPLPCITVVETPRGTSYTTISDFCSKSSPMIPPLIVHCVIEVEARGLNEIGLYRIPGSERDVKCLKEKILRGKGICLLSSYDIHVICGTIKDFLIGLNEPLLTYALWPEFIRAIEHADPSDRMNSLRKTIAQLPQPNRDTLAFMIQHLQRVAQSPDCKMPKSSLAKIFGPTIVGYSSLELGKTEMYQETSRQAQVMECLLDMPSEYWNNIISEEHCENDQIVTPMGTSLLHKRSRSRSRKLFSTPPVK